MVLTTPMAVKVTSHPVDPPIKLKQATEEDDRWVVTRSSDPPKYKIDTGPIIMIVLF